MTGVRPKALDHVGLKVSDMDRSLLSEGSEMTGVTDRRQRDQQ